MNLWFGTRNFRSFCKSFSLKCAGCVTCIEDVRMQAEVELESMKERDLYRCLCSWKDDIKTNLKHILWEGVDWITLDSWEAPIRGSYEHGKGPSRYVKGGKFLANCTIVIFSDSALWSLVCLCIAVTDHFYVVFVPSIRDTLKVFPVL